MSQNFMEWKKILDDLVSRRSAVPSLNLDQQKISNIQRIKALCSLQTKEVSNFKSNSTQICCIIRQPNKLNLEKTLYAATVCPRFLKAVT